MDLGEQRMTLLVGVAIIAAAVYATVRGVDVRLALLLAALALGVLAGAPQAIVRMFLATFSNEQFVVPICTAMGFAYVLRLTQCDQHLVHLLVRPLSYVRPLLIPGTVVVGFLVNIPVVSQTSTAVTIGPVVIPLLLAARLSPVTIGAALLLGSSVGGELLNPGAPELQTTVQESRAAALRLKMPPPDLTVRECVHYILPLDLLGLAVATTLFWLVSLRAEARGGKEGRGPEVVAPPDAATEPFRVSWLRALVPLVPLLLLFLTGPPLELIAVEREWLVEPRDAARFNSRLVGAAMLVGVAVAAAVVRRSLWGVAGAFFEGAGYGFTHIISLIVAASCLGEGVKRVGLTDLVGSALEEAPGLLLPAAGLLPLAFGVLCGSGMASTQALFPLFAPAALKLGIDPAHVGAVVSVASAAGRTLSPVAAVTLMCAALTQTSPLCLVRRLAVPVLAAMAAVVLAAVVMAAGP
jgi:DcuC family C4-dicarboxylate transporter